jgi:SAM-dependent methyltransferase
MSSADAAQNALTDESYWDSVWSFFDQDPAGLEPPRIYPEPTALWRDDAIGRFLARGRRFLEIGAGGSPWPAHVAQKYGAEAWGIDFSRPGLALAARAVASNHRLVRLIEGDFFDPAKLPAGTFDLVYSSGFVEHFTSPQPLMKRMAELLKPDGVVVTSVPNLGGLNGTLQRLADRETFDRHVVISPTKLDAIHALGGLVPVLPARYIGVVDLSSVNYSRLAGRMPPLLLRGLQFTLAKVLQAGGLYHRLTRRDGGPWLAPMVGGIYRRQR